MSYCGHGLWVLLCSLTFEGIWGKRADGRDPSLGEVAMGGAQRRRENMQCLGLFWGCFSPKQTGEELGVEMFHIFLEKGREKQQTASGGSGCFGSMKQ